MDLNFSKQPDGIVFSGKISNDEIANLKLDGFDRALLGEKIETASDFLLVLEMLFRRRQQELRAKADIGAKVLDTNWRRKFAARNED